MSKAIKLMQMDALKGNFKDVRDIVFLNIVGLDAVSENKMRLDLRKKGVRLHQVKNTLFRRVLGDMGMKVEGAWAGPTTVAWGGSSVSELSKEIEGLVKKHDKKIKVKTALADGTEVTFAQALKMPSKAEAIGRVVMLAVSPGRRIAGAVVGPAGKVSGQVKSVSEKKEEAPAAPVADAPAPA